MPTKKDKGSGGLSDAIGGIVKALPLLLMALEKGGPVKAERPRKKNKVAPKRPKSAKAKRAGKIRTNRSIKSKLPR